MVTPEERLKILKMLQEGKITADQAVKLLEAMQDARKGRSSEQPLTAQPRTPRWFHVTVTDPGTGKVRVNIRLPVSVITAGVKMGARFSTDLEGVDMEQVIQMIRQGEIGKVVDVYDEKDSEHIEVFLE
jgi:hypothetical protein